MWQMAGRRGGGVGVGGHVKEEILFLRSLQEHRLAPVPTHSSGQQPCFFITLFALGRLGGPQVGGKYCRHRPTWGSQEVQIKGAG